MNSPETLEPFVRALLHTLWQGGLLAMLLAGSLRLIPASRAQLRYLLSGLALIAVLLGGIGAWAMRDVSFRRALQAETALPQAAPAPIVAASHPVSGKIAYENRRETPDSPPRWTTVLTLGWLCGTVVFLGRTAVAFVGAGRLRRNAREILPLPAIARKTLASLKMANRRVRLFASEQIKTPAVIGFFAPAILLPAALLAGAPPELLRAVLAHELAHIRRWDYLVNLGQMLVESLLFFNPFVWWISRQMRQEREACCDQIAAMHCGSHSRYLEALMTCVAEASPVAAVAATGGERTLLDRARRLLDPGYRPAMRMRGVTFAAVLAITGLLLVALLAGARIAAEILTPQQRIEKITEIKKEYAPKMEDEGPRHKITVSGFVVTADGKPFDKKQRLLIESRRADLLGLTTLAMIQEDGRFSIDIPSGQISIKTVVPGYAPASWGPFKVDRDRHDLRITLSKKYDGRILIVDEEGNPIRSALVTGIYDSNLEKLEAISDLNGMATLPSTGDYPLDLSITMKGFEFERRTGVRFPEKAPLRWVLNQAIPFKGRIVSLATGEPIENTEITLAAVGGPDSHAYDSSSAPLLGTTDANGEFTLDSLSSDSPYLFYLSAKGYGKSLSPPVTVDGSTRVEWKLAPPRSISGTVVFPSSTAFPKTVTVECGQMIIIPAGNGFSFGPSSRVPVENGIAKFEFNDLLAMPTFIRVGGRETQLPEFSTSVHDLVIEYPAERSKAERLVEIGFDLPPSAPAPTGSILVSFIKYFGQTGMARVQISKTVSIKEGTARLVVPTPNEVTFEPTGLVGYAFERTTVTIPEGGKPHSLRLPVTPAGAIYGEITEADGFPAYSLMISAYLLPDAKGNPPAQSLSVKNSSRPDDDPSDQFVATPLTLNATYAIVVHRGPTYVLSTPVSLNERNPIQKMKLVVPEGTPVRVKVTDQKGKPVPGLRWDLNFSASWGYNSTSGGFWTDRDGWLIIPHVNFDAPGEYRVKLNHPAYLSVDRKIDPRKPEFAIQLEDAKPTP